MKSLANNLRSEMERQLQLIHLETAEPIVYSERAILLIISVLEDLKANFIANTFENKNSEIEFFKIIKPQFAYKLIYYNEVYNIETSKPSGSEKALRKFYNLELDKLKDFFDDNIDFYKYYRTGSIHLDKKYFVRGKHDIRLTIDSSYFQADHRFSTSHDFKVARIMANDLLQVYLEGEISKLERRAIHNITKEKDIGMQKWTGSKVALIELIYALHAEGVFNNGTSDLKEVALFFENSLHVDLGQYHRTFLEIRTRKSERTKFLNSLRETFLRRMDEADEV